MRRYISNYIILPDASVLHNHIVSIDDGCLVELQQFSGELAYTIYVPNPILIISEANSSIVENLFESSADLLEFCDLLLHCNLSQNLEPRDSIVVLELDFQQRYFSKLD